VTFIGGRESSPCVHGDSTGTRRDTGGWAARRRSRSIRGRQWTGQHPLARALAERWIRAGRDYNVIVEAAVGQNNFRHVTAHSDLPRPPSTRCHISPACRVHVSPRDGSAAEELASVGTRVRLTPGQRSPERGVSTAISLDVTAGRRSDRRWLVIAGFVMTLKNPLPSRRAQHSLQSAVARANLPAQQRSRRRNTRRRQGGGVECGAYATRGRWR